MSTKPKLAFYWCASCGGCDEALIDLDEVLLDVAAAVDIVFWPAAMDFKVSDVENLDDGAIDFTLINGAVRTDEQRHMAQLLRRKSDLVVGFGACAQLGGVVALANLLGPGEVFRTSYLQSASLDNPQGVRPRQQSSVCGYPLTLPRFWDHVAPLGEVIEVDCYVPGCPPPVELIKQALEALLGGARPRGGAVLAPSESLCATCARNESKPAAIKVDGFRLLHELEADGEKCFLEQGIICCGPATRGGCGEPCIGGNMPCTGCLGPLPEVAVPEAALLTALATLLDARSATAAERQAATFLDPAGTAGRYGTGRPLGRDPSRGDS